MRWPAVPGNRPMRVLLVEDDPMIGSVVQHALRDASYAADWVVDGEAALTALRRLAPGLTLSPASGDDLAQRLGLRHYPVLITSTGIEQ